MPHWLFLLQQARRQLWLTVALYSLLGLAASLLAAALGRYVPSDFPLKLGSDSVDDILSILATSMLAVATFAMTTLVSAYTSVNANLSPRAGRLLIGDSGVRNPLGTFIGAFIYSVVGIIAVHTGYYGAQGRVILFFVTLGVLLGIVLAMLRWIGQLSAIAQSHNVIGRLVECAATALHAPTTNLASAQGDGWGPPETGWAVRATAIGFVKNIDMRRLDALTKHADVEIYIDLLPGAFAHPGKPLIWIAGAPLGEKTMKKLRACVVIGPERTFDQDPLFGLQVLGEIAARALSPGVNDAGTAREVVSRTVALLAGDAASRGSDPERGRIHVRPIGYDDLLAMSLGPVAQYGAADVLLQLELHRRLQVLAHCSSTGLSAAAQDLSRAALERAVLNIDQQHERERLVRAAALVAQARPSDDRSGARCS